MGLVVKQRKKYVSHKKRWDKNTIVEEKALTDDYALKNKKEVRKIEFMIGKFKKIAKELNQSAETKQSERAINFISKLKDLGFLGIEASTLDDVLDIKVRDVLERRLSNLVYRHKLARTPRQARQFVVHGHIKVDDKLVTAPGYLVSLKEESSLSFSNRSALVDEEHPERKLVPQGMQEMKEELEETPLKEEQPDMDKVEEKLDDEEVDEVKEE